MIKMSYFEKPAPLMMTVGELGVDLNTDSFAAMAVTWNMADETDTEPIFKFFDKLEFSRNPKVSREETLYGHVNHLVQTAADNHWTIVLEKLDFEWCKFLLRNKLGQLLREFPYRRIKAIFERRCAEHGVPLKYVNPRHTSNLGGILATRLGTGRDESAGGCIALRGSDKGNRWLEETCAKMLEEKEFRVRINAKGKFGREVMVRVTETDQQKACAGPSPASEPEKETETAMSAFDKTGDDNKRSAQKALFYGSQMTIGRCINEVTKRMGSEFWLSKGQFGTRGAIMRLKVREEAVTGPKPATCPGPTVRTPGSKPPSIVGEPYKLAMTTGRAQL
jgi:IS605 OrfB family transposase